jgi:hypothetical protein
MSAYIRAGWGFTVGNDFARAKVDTPIEVDPKEYALPRHVVGYIAGDPNHALGFMRYKLVRVHVSVDALGGAQ